MPPTQVDLTISLEGLDTDGLLGQWRWLVPLSHKPIMMTKFGDWFFVDAEGHISILDLIEGSLRKVAQSISEFNTLKNQPENHTEWFFDGLVFRCVKEGLNLAPSECYGWKIHPMIGGKFEFENIQVFSLHVYQSLMGQIFRQYKQLKPGDKIPPIRIS